MPPQSTSRIFEYSNNHHYHLLAKRLLMGGCNIGVDCTQGVVEVRVRTLVREWWPRLATILLREWLVDEPGRDWIIRTSPTIEANINRKSVKQRHGFSILIIIVIVREYNREGRWSLTCWFHLTYESGVLSTRSRHSGPTRYCCSRSTSYGALLTSHRTLR